MQYKEILQGVDLWVTVLWAGLIIGSLSAVVIFWVKAFPIVRKFIAFVNDVAGEEARPGFPARPGLFDRIHNIEQTQKSVAEKVEKVHHELFPNSGKSLRDQTNRIEAKVSADYREIGNLKNRVEDLNLRFDEHIGVATGILKSLQEKEQ